MSHYRQSEEDIYKDILLLQFVLVARNIYNILVRRFEGKRPLVRPRRRWEANIRMILREVGWKGLDWVQLVKDREQWRVLVNRVMNLHVP
jgi:hypothetical protein